MKDLKPLFTDHIQKVTAAYTQVMTELGYNWLVIHSGSLDYRFQDDMSLPFKVNAHFNYFVPVVDNPDCFVILQPGKKPKLLFFLASDFWYIMPEHPKGYWVDAFDIEIIEDVNSLKSFLPANMAGAAYIGPSGMQFKSMGIKQLNPQHLMNRLHFLRAVKTSYEQELMKEATRVAVTGHLAAKQAFHHGGSEFEIHLAYLNAVQAMESDLPYGNIIALNEHGSVLHYQVTDKSRKPNHELHSFLIDAGAQVSGYAADITRTYSFLEDEFAELIHELDKEQLAIISQLRIGDPYPQTHLRAHGAVARLLHDFKFIDLSTESIMDKKLTSFFFPHGIGHLLGMQVHDVAGFSSNPQGDLIAKPEGHPFLRLTRTIQEGFVFTIEPGFYFIDPLLKDLKNSENGKYVNWSRVDSFRKFGGIRIEDNICMTKSGPDNWTRTEFEKQGQA